MHSDSYATVLSISGNAHILWYTTPEGGVNSAWLGGVKFFRRGVLPPLGWLDKPLRLTLPLGVIPCEYPGKLYLSRN